MFEHPNLTKQIDYTLICRYKNPDGSLLAEFESSGQILDSWDTSYHWGYYGWPNPGNWQSGTYTVQILQGSTELASGSFSIVEACCNARAFTFYEDTVLKAYVAYYGWPADVGGLQWWAAELEKRRGDLAAIIDAFGNSAEFTDRYGGLDAHSLVNNLYLQLFGRDAEPAGLNWWVGELQSNRRPLTRIALDVLYGATGIDLTVMENRLAVARHYVTAAEELGGLAVEPSAADLSGLISPVDATPASVEAACGMADALLLGNGEAAVVVDQGGGVVNLGDDARLEIPAGGVAQATNIAFDAPGVPAGSGEEGAQVYRLTADGDIGTLFFSCINRTGAVSADELEVAWVDFDTGTKYFPLFDYLPADNTIHFTLDNPWSTGGGQGTVAFSLSSYDLADESLGREMYQGFIFIRKKHLASLSGKYPNPILMPFYTQVGQSCWSAATAMLSLGLVSGSDNSFIWNPLYIHKYTGVGFDTGITMLTNTGTIAKIIGGQGTCQSFVFRDSARERLLAELDEGHPVMYSGDMQIDTREHGTHQVLIVGYHYDAAGNLILTKLDPQGTATTRYTEQPWSEFDDTYTQAIYLCWSESAPPADRALVSFDPPIGYESYLKFFAYSGGDLADTYYALTPDHSQSGGYGWANADSGQLTNRFQPNTGMMEYALRVNNTDTVDRDVEVTVTLICGSGNSLVHRKTMLIPAGNSIISSCRTGYGFAGCVSMAPLLKRLTAPCEGQVRIEVDGIPSVSNYYTNFTLTPLSMPTVAAKEIDGGCRITLKQAKNIDIYYTLDGSEPDVDHGIKYSGPFDIDTAAGPVTLKAAACVVVDGMPNLWQKSAGVEPICSPTTQHICPQKDAAAGSAWVLQRIVRYDRLNDGIWSVDPCYRMHHTLGEGFFSQVTACIGKLWLNEELCICANPPISGPEIATGSYSRPPAVIEPGIDLPVWLQLATDNWPIYSAYIGCSWCRDATKAVFDEQGYSISDDQDYYGGSALKLRHNESARVDGTISIPVGCFLDGTMKVCGGAMVITCEFSQLDCNSYAMGYRYIYHWVDNVSPTSETRTYHDSGALKTVTTWRDGAKNGPVVSYHENGVVSARATYLNGLVEGTAWDYYDDGTLRKMANSVGGKANGPAYYYDENGVLTTMITFVDGVKEGVTKEYNPDGTVKREYVFVNGVVDPDSMVYY